MNKLSRTLSVLLLVLMVTASCGTLSEDFSEISPLDSEITLESGGGDGGEPELPNDGK